MFDRMIFQDLELEANIGYYENERDTKQKLVLYFEALVKPMSPKHTDDPKYIVINYATACQILLDYFSANRFHLIEAAAEGAAKLLLKNFDLAEIKVRLKKTPADMPKGSSVIYECVRRREDVL